VIAIKRKTVLRLVLPLAFFLSLLSIHPALGDEPFPAPQGLINDFAGIIPPAYEERMTSLAREVLERADAALTVVTVKDIGGANIDDFTNRLYERWGVGRKGEDRGVMILVALKERRIRIEVGYGLEGIIPDGLAGQIRDQAIVPYLKNDEFGPGLFNGLSALAGIIAKDRGIELAVKPAVPQEATSKRGRTYGLFPLLFLLFIFFLLFRSGRLGVGTFLLLMLLGGGRGGSRGGGSMGGFSGGFGGFGGGMSGGGGASGSF
jgi:uncharacterized protein